MRAVVYYGPKDIRTEDFEEPSCAPGEIRAKVDACAVCGTDLKSFLVGNPRLKAPIVMGHEFTGVIDTVGDGVTGFAPGERVVMATSVSCGECYYCGKGHPNLCANVAPMGFSYNGGMAEYVTIPERAIRNAHVIKVPEGVRPEHAALAEPVSCCVNSCENCDVKAGDTVVVIGAGPMGIINGCVARELGAAKIILAEINEIRLAQAKPFGFDILVNPANEDLVQVVADQTGGVGADVVIVAAPAAQPQEQAPAMTRKRGTVCLFASLPVGKNMISLDSRIIHYGEIRVVGTSDSTPAHVTKAVELIAGGSMPVDKLATHVLDLYEIDKAYELMKSGESLRVVLTP
jgi:L-iditol 2-dehydrogenase